MTEVACLIDYGIPTATVLDALRPLGVTGLRVGPQIAPGVPWTASLDGAVDLALKSGNFGDEDFFSAAQRLTDPRT